MISDTARKDCKKECPAGWIIRIGKRKILHFMGSFEEAVRYAEENAKEGEDITIA